LGIVLVTKRFRLVDFRKIRGSAFFPFASVTPRKQTGGVEPRLPPVDARYSDEEVPYIASRGGLLCRESSHAVKCSLSGA
jgi:hypothetical protein